MLISNIKNSKDYRDQIKHIEHIDSKKPEFVEDLSELNFHPKILDYLSRCNIKLYKHQFEAIKILKQKKNMMITSATSSGKSLIYILGILDEILKNPHSTAILLFPRKALSRDQLEKFHQICEFIGLNKSVIGVYDGDTSRSTKKAILYKSNIIITNPYGLHQYLSWHKQWARIFSNLKYLIIDEVHMYRGVFGSNIAFFLRRFNRVMKIYNDNFVYGLFSATIGNPIELSEKIINKDVEFVDIDTSAQRKKDLIIWEPPYIERSNYYLNLKSQAIYLFKHLTTEKIQSLMFVQSRNEAEDYAIKIKNTLKKEYPQLSNLIMSYRAGISANDRRNIEKDIKNKKLLGIISTNALEVGIDIGDLDSVILGGFPGSINSFWQQAGRAGRTKIGIHPDQQQNALIFYIAKASPLDMYYARNFNELLNLNHEDAIIDLENIIIVKNHLWCAVYEKDILESELNDFGINAEKAINELINEGKVKKIGSRYQKVNNDFAAGAVSLSNINKNLYQIFVINNDGTKSQLTLEDESIVLREIYPETIYLYMTEKYLVLAVDYEKKRIEVKKEDFSYKTKVLMNEDVQIISEIKKKEINDLTFCYGDVNVISTPTSIIKIDDINDRIIGNIPIKNPQESNLETKAIWWVIPRTYSTLTLKPENTLKYFKSLKNLNQNEIDFDDFIHKNDINDLESSVLSSLSSNNLAGGIHAMEHACISMIPYFQLCDRKDVGGISTLRHPDTRLPTVLIYDGFQGGIGITDRIFNNVEALFDKTENMISSCKCKNGCPACVLSPNCGNNNTPMNKHAGLVLLNSLKFKKKKDE